MYTWKPCKTNIVVPGNDRKDYHKNFRDLSGLKFNYVTVVSCEGRNYKLKPVYKCLCQCGTYFTAEGQCLKNGHIQSCGCLKRKVNRSSMLTVRARPEYKPHSRPHKMVGEISRTFFSQFRSGALKRELAFSISHEYVAELFERQNHKCALTGLPIVAKFKSGYKPNNRNGRLNNPTASLDRIDSSKGYVEGNVQWVHKKINIMKMDLPETYFKTTALIIGWKFRDSILERLGLAPIANDLCALQSESEAPLLASA